MKRVLTIFGTRPEAIKMAPVVHELNARSDRIRCTTCVTAQHRELLDQVLADFSIMPDIDLDLMTPGQDLFDITARVLTEVRDVLSSVKPDLVLVHGDTTTAMTAAMAAFYAGIPVGHVEAGLRTYRMDAPFPEEMNRQVIGRLAQLHFAPTEQNRSNLLQERISETGVFVTGNTVIDALLYMRQRVQHQADVNARVLSNIHRLGLDDRVLENRSMILVTGHRRENFGRGFEQICAALHDLASTREDLCIVYPVHLNPNVRTVVSRTLGDHPRIRLVPPVDYETFIWLMDRAALILTDSGGIQEEGPALGKPVLVMRETTERPEGVSAGTVRLVGTDASVIRENVIRLLDDSSAYRDMACAVNPYGDGKAAFRICDIVERFLAEEAL